MPNDEIRMSGSIEQRKLVAIMFTHMAGSPRTDPA